MSLSENTGTERRKRTRKLAIKLAAPVLLMHALATTVIGARLTSIEFAIVILTTAPLSLISLSMLLVYANDLRFSAARAATIELIGNEGRFALLLRSSECDSRFGVHQPATGYEHGLERGIYTNFELLLTPLPLKLIKNPDLAIDQATITYSESTWKKEIIEDMMKAEFIVLLPLWISNAVMWELETIQKLNLLGRVIIFMPPQPTVIDSELFPEEKLDTDWMATTSLLSELGLSVARYDPRGGILAQSQSGSFTDFTPWNKISRRSIDCMVTPAYSA